MGASGSDLERLSLRRLLQLVAVSSVDLEALCLDHFPQVYRLFSQGMNRTARENLLLEMIPAPELLAVLRTVAPHIVAQHAPYSFAEGPPKNGELPANPYRGLAAFATEDAHLFFGRETQTRLLLALLERLIGQSGVRRMLTLLGPSGSGKSSLARAGIAYGLSRRDVASNDSRQAVIVRPGRRPFLGLARGLVSIALPRGAETDGGLAEQLAAQLYQRGLDGSYDGICRILERVPEADRPSVVIVVDQFEELYSECTDEAVRNGFVDALLYAATDRLVSVTVVLVLRSDCLVEVARYHPALSQAISASNSVIPAMTQEELRSAIAEPALRAGVPFDPAVIDLLLEQTRKNANSLPLLQFALTQIWNGIVDGRSPAETLRTMGGVGGALARQAQALYRDLTVQNQVHLRRIFLQLVQVGSGIRDTCRRVPLGQLIGHRVSEADVLTLLQPFTDERRRLLTLSSPDASGKGERHVEITHEALLEHWEDLHNWVAEAHEDQRFHDRISESVRLWDKDGRHTGRLWRSPDLDLLRDYFRRCGETLTRLELEFYKTAEYQLARERWLWRIWILLPLCIICSCIVLYYREDSRLRQATEATLHLAQGRSDLLSGKAYAAFRHLLSAAELGSEDVSLKYLLADAARPLDALRVVITGHAPQMSTGNFSPDGKQVVIASGDGTARVVDARTGSTLLILNGHQRYVNSAAYSPDGTRILTSSADRTARIWNAATGQLQMVLSGHTHALNSAAWSPDGSFIITASADRTARIFDSRSGVELQALIGHEKSVNDATFSPDGELILTGSADGTARLWHREGGRLRRTLKAHHGPINGVAFDPTGTTMATAAADQQVYLWPLDSDHFSRVLIGHESYVNSVRWSGDGRYILTASADGTAALWDAKTLQLLQILDGHLSAVKRAEFDSTGTRVVTAGNDRTVRIWNLGNAEKQRTLLNAGQPIRGGTLSHSQRLIAIATDDRIIRIVDAQTGAPLSELRGHQGAINGLTFSWDDKLIASAAEDGSVSLWDLGKSELRRVVQTGQAGILSVAFSPDDSAFLAGGKDGQTSLWNIERGSRICLLSKHDDWVNSVGFSPDGQLAFTASSDRRVRIFHTDTWTEAYTLSGHQQQVRSAAFSPSGKLLITGSEDQTAQLWEVGSWQRLHVLQDHRAAVRAVGISRDDERLLTMTPDQRTCVWDRASGQALSCLRAHFVPVKAAQFSSEGQHVFTFNEDGVVRLWDVGEEKRTLAELKELLRCVEPVAPLDVSVQDRPSSIEWQACSREAHR